VEEEDPWKMGVAGARVTKGDFVAMGEWVEARADKWKTMTNKQRWGPFHAKVRPQGLVCYLAVLIWLAVPTTICCLLGRGI
jgi:hypothetical protein